MIKLRPHEAPPVPPFASRGNPIVKAIKSLEVGEFLFVTAGERRPERTAACAHRLGLVLGRQFACRPMTFRGIVGCGIWRQLDKPQPETEWETAVTREAGGISARANHGVPKLKVAGR